MTEYRRSLGRAFAVLLRHVVALALAGFVAAVVTGASEARAQTLQADAEPTVEKGFGRLVITFKGRMLLPQYVVKSNNGVLVIQFAEPVKVNVERVPLTLGAYVTVGRRDPDGMALRFALARLVKINTMDAGEKLFIDFLPTAWNGPPPPLPEAVVQDLAKRAEAALKAQREAENRRFGLKVLPKLDFRVGRQPTFTRLSFGWNLPFDTQMVRDGDRVTVTFNRPAAIDLTQLVADPPPGLREISADDSGGNLKIAMLVAPDADVRAFREDQTYVVDVTDGSVRPPSPQATPVVPGQSPDIPAGAKNKIEALRSVAPVPAAKTDEPDVMTGEAPPSEMPAAPAVAKPGGKPPERIAAKPVDKAPDAAVEPRVAAPGVADKAGPKAPATKTADTGRPEERTPRVPAGKPNPAPPVPAVIAAETPPAVPKASMPPPAAPAATMTPAADMTGPAGIAEAPPAAQVPGAMESPMPPAPNAEPSAPVKSASPVTAADKIGTGEMPPSGADVAVDQQKVVRVEARRTGSVARLVFPFSSRVAAAAFRRNNRLWLVFDSRLPLDMKMARTALEGIARDVAVETVDNAVSIRIDLKQQVLTTISADGSNWFLSIGETILEPSRPLQIRRTMRTEQTGQLLVDLADAGSVHDLTDPSSGMKMTVVTAFAPARGILKEQVFAELQALPTAHGVAIAPFADDVHVSIERNVVIIGREKGLSLSPGPGSERSDAPVPHLDVRQKRVAADAKSFFAATPDAFAARERDLETAISEAPDKDKSAKRLALADFFITHRFAPEALGVLRLVALDDPGIERDPGFLVLFGAAQTMTGRVKEASQVLVRPAVTDSADAALWRTIAFAELQRWDQARDAAQQAAPAVGAYPPDIQALFTLAAAETAVELNDFGAATSRLAEIEPETVDPSLAVRYDLLQARIMDAAGRPDDAMLRLDRAAESSDRRGAAEAEYLRLRILNRDHKLDDQQTIDRLKSLGFGWRGDRVELLTLRFLATLQAANGHYREAFNSMRSAVMVDGNSATTKKLQEDMGKVFLDLYLDGKADTLPPIEALTLYYDFRDLTPIGKLGDEIVRNLADRLIGVDLLDQAAELLDYQINNRLRGVEKAQIAADLAVVHLLNRRPDQALAVINKTRQSSLPASIERQRRIVEARALSESGRGELGTEMLGQLNGSDIDRLKADIAWKAKNWRDAGERLETMLAGRWRDEPPLTTQDRQDVLRAAIAYALANDPLALDRLRTKFSAKMADSPNSRAFDVVTAPLQTQGSEFRAVAREIAAIDTMRGFLDEYRQQYMNGHKQPPTQPPAVSTPPKPGAALNDKANTSNKLAAADAKTPAQPMP